MTQDWTKWEKQVVNGVFPLHAFVSFSDHSAVFLTEHKALNLPNALLKLVPAIPTLKEAQLAQWTAAASLAHPNLIQLLDAGRCQLGGLQFLFVVMEYAEQTLARILSQRALAPDALRNGLRPILASLGFLHRKQLVQGGLKPSNILLVDQQLKLASDSVRPTGESTASIAGSSVYDPPESRDGSFSTAGDIWSLGVLMVEALTQRQPSWPGRHAATATLPETLPPQFAQIIRQCLDRDPAKRPTVDELEAQIDPAPPASVASVRYPVLFPPEPTEPSPQPYAAKETDPVAPARQWVKWRSFAPTAAEILIALALVWMGVRLFGSQDHAQPTALPAVTAQIPTIAAAPASSEVSAGPPSSASSGEPTAAAASVVLHEESPDVPPGALQTIHGHIRFAVRVTVDPAGDVIRAALASHSPSKYFTRLAIETAQKWKFVADETQGARHMMLWFELTRDGATAHAAIPQTYASARNARANASGE